MDVTGSLEETNRTSTRDAEADSAPTSSERIRAVPKLRTPTRPLRAFRADLDRYLPEGASWQATLRCFLLRTEIHAIFLFRLGTWIYCDCPGPISMLFRLFWRPLNLFVEQLTDIHLRVGTAIGPGLYISHRGGIWVNPQARIGSNCTLTPGVIIGASGGASDRKIFPVVGDRVWIGPHAVVAGSARVGNDCVVAANSLVVSRVPDKANVIGVPATILNHWGSTRLLGRISTRI